MARIKCPHCDVVLSNTCLAEGWCECGKRIPQALLDKAAPPPAKTQDKPRHGGTSILGTLLLAAWGIGILAIAYKEFRISDGKYSANP